MLEISSLLINLIPIIILKKTHKNSVKLMKFLFSFRENRNIAQKPKCITPIPQNN